MALDAPPLENPPRRLLIIDTAWLGDIVFTTSLIGSVRQVWPDVELHVLTAPRGQPLLEGHPHIQRLWIYDKHGTQRGLLALLAQGRALAECRFDVVLNAHPSYRSRALTYLAHAPIQVNIVNNLAVNPDHVARRIDLLRAIHPEAEAAPLRVAVQPDALAEAQRFLQDLEAKPPYLGMIPASAWETKQWPARNFADLSHLWHSKTGGASLVFGGPANEGVVSSILRDGRGVVPVVGCSLPVVAALLSQCQAAVGNDTGVSFLAIASSTGKVIVLYGCTQVNFSFPPPHRAITADVPCCLPRTGHGAHRCRWTSGRPWCMEQISVPRVWEELMKSSPAPFTLSNVTSPVPPGTGMCPPGPAAGG